MSRADLAVLDCRQLLTLKGPIPKRKEELQNIGLIEKGSIASYQGRIVFVGKDRDFKNEIELEKDATLIDASDLVCLPGFIDSHTHLPYAGSREEEFVLRSKAIPINNWLSRALEFKPLSRLPAKHQKRSSSLFVLAGLTKCLFMEQQPQKPRVAMD